jgi:hypothetical protein
LRVYTWTQVLNGRTVRCVVATHSRNKAAHLARGHPGTHVGRDGRITASLEIGETINPVLVTVPLEKLGAVLYFEGGEFRAFEAA